MSDKNSESKLKRWYQSEGFESMRPNCNDLVNVDVLINAWNHQQETIDEQAERIDKLKKLNSETRKRLREFVIFGTDDCPECYSADDTDHYMGCPRTTLFYRPIEHDLHEPHKWQRVIEYQV